MTISDYYQVLGLSKDASVEEIKKAYRQKARLYHPDINSSADAKDMFIIITEAYDFLLTNHKRRLTDDEEYLKAMDEWRKYRQDRSRRQAGRYAQTSFTNFKKTQFYKTTRILDCSTIIFSLTISVLVIVYTIFGYIYRLNHPLPGLENPSVFTLIMLLALGIIFLIVSLVYLKVFLETSKKNKNKS